MTIAQAKSMALNELARKKLALTRKTLDASLAIQCQDGNWNYSPYQLGFTNGMILARAVLNGESPKFMDSPEEWRQDRHGGLETVLPSNDAEFLQAIIDSSVVSVGDEIRG